MSSEDNLSGSESPPSRPSAPSQAVPAGELRDRLETRLQYATVKVNHSRENESVAELNHHCFNPFVTQARARCAERADKVISRLKQHNQLDLYNEDEAGCPGKVWERMNWFEPYDRDRVTSREKVALEEEEDGKDTDSAPTPSPIYDQPPQGAPYLAICPPKPPSSTGGTSVDTVVEYSRDDAYYSSEENNLASPTLSHTPDTLNGANLALLHENGTSIESGSALQTTSSSRPSVSAFLSAHKYDSPFSAHHPISATLAPANFVDSLSMPVVVGPFVPDTSEPSSRTSNSSRQTFLLSSQPSFSALPPPPPLPFADQPTDSHQYNQQSPEEEPRKRARARLSSSPQAPGQSSRSSKRLKLPEPSDLIDLNDREPPPSSPLGPASSPGQRALFHSSTSSPPFPFPATQSSTSSSRQPELDLRPFGKYPIDGVEGDFIQGESQQSEDTGEDSQQTVEESAD